MSKVISCGIVPIRRHGGKIEILLCKPTCDSYFGMGFLKGQMEDGETELESAMREFSEESGGLEVELFDEKTFFSQDNPNKLIHIWPAMLKEDSRNLAKIAKDGSVPQHDHENELIKFYDIERLPKIFKNQEKILSQLMKFIDENIFTF